jgi:hypothetical protein
MHVRTAIHQRRYHAQECFMLGIQRPIAEKCADVDFGYDRPRERSVHA